MDEIPESDETFIETVRETVAGEVGEGSRLEAVEDSIPTEGGADNDIFNAALAAEILELHGLECLECGHAGTVADGTFSERENALGNSRHWSGSHLYFHVKCECGAIGQVVIEPSSYDDQDAPSLGYLDTDRCRIKMNDAVPR